MDYLEPWYNWVSHQVVMKATMAASTHSRLERRRDEAHDHVRQEITRCHHTQSEYKLECIKPINSSYIMLSMFTVYSMQNIL